MKHEVYTQREERHTITLSLAELVAHFQASGVLPYGVVWRECNVTTDDEAVCIEWTERSSETTEVKP